MVLRSIRCETVRLRRALVALFVALFVITPVIDGFLCAGEAVSAHAAITDVSAHSAITDIDGDNGGGREPLLPRSDELCIHGHCHHFVPMAAPGSVVVAVSPVALTPAWIDPYIPSVLPFSFERPPRV